MKTEEAVAEVVWAVVRVAAVPVEVELPHVLNAGIRSPAHPRLLEEAVDAGHRLLHPEQCVLLVKRVRQGQSDDEDEGENEGIHGDKQLL